jgi:hypothetical protein
VRGAIGEELSAHEARIGTHIVSLLRDTAVLAGPVRAGVAEASGPDDVPQALHRAKVALRATDQLDGVGPSVINYADLGAMAAVIEQFPPPQAAAVSDVRDLELWMVAPA